MTWRMGRIQAWLATALLLWLAACAPGVVAPAVPAVLHSPTPTTFPNATRSVADALSHIHNASADDMPLSASITFTADTTFDQATAILRGHVYPWTCDEPRSNVPPSVAEQHANFARWHSLNMFYPAWDELVRIAASPQVVSVEGGTLYPCP
ncbi:MAG TPA: hypothetical protein VFS83_14350 [Ktedonobacterales bacterium]|nr:hypothetical protein [Ktedonobacterales bacterium]